MDVFKNLLKCLLLVLIAALGDRLVLINRHNELLKAVCDNCTHAAIGFMTWINVQYDLPRASTGRTMLVHSLLCALIASAVDVDHFISARSFYLQDATSLTRRPLLHCTTLAMILSSLMLIVAHLCQSNSLKVLGWIILAAFISHHTRDAARRGFWLWPFGSTPPLGQVLYLFLTALLPYILSAAMLYTKESAPRLELDAESISIV